MRKPRVFITQVPNRKDHDTNAFVPTVNIAPAAEHGEVIVMMPPNASFHATRDLTEQLREHLCEYDYESGDSLIALGDPAVIAVACAILGRDHGRFKLLKWDRNVSRYLPAHIDLGPQNNTAC